MVDKSADERLAVRHVHGDLLTDDLHGLLTAQRAKLSRNHDLAKAVNYMLRRWNAFTCFLDRYRRRLVTAAANLPSIEAPR